MSRRSVRTRRRSRLRRFLLKQMKQLSDRAPAFEKGMTLEFVITFGDWCSLHERVKRLPR